MSLKRYAPEIADLLERIKKYKGICPGGDDKKKKGVKIFGKLIEMSSELMN